jgi:hypothetical protein
MDEFVHKLRILARTEMTLGKLHGRRLASQSIAYATALLLGLTAVAMLNLAAYHWLAAAHGNATAALWMGGGDILLAAVVAFWAGRQKPGTEEALVEEIQDMVLAQLQADVQGVGDDFSKIRNAVTGGGLAALMGIAPLVTLVVEHLKRNRE